MCSEARWCAKRRVGVAKRRFGVAKRRVGVAKRRVGVPRGVSVCQEARWCCQEALRCCQEACWCGLPTCASVCHEALSQRVGVPRHMPRYIAVRARFVSETGVSDDFLFATYLKNCEYHLIRHVSEVAPPLLDAQQLQALSIEEISHMPHVDARSPPPKKKKTGRANA